MATANALYLTELAGRTDVPVCQGAIKSLRGAAKERIADFVHGTDGFGNTGQPAPKGKASDEPAAAFIVRMANAYPGQVVVLALAALTNVALAMHLDPQLPEKLSRIVVLGGAFFCNGNVNPAAEANIFGDPDAANVVFSRAPNCWVVGLDVTHRCRITQQQLESLAGRGKYGTFLRDISQFYLQYHKGVYDMDAVYIHDASAFAAVVDPSLFTWLEGSVVVVADGVAKGHTIMDQGKKQWVGVNEWMGLPKLRVAVDVDSQRLVDWVVDRMGM